MSLIYCPECGHEVSNTAVACPQCGRPLNVQPVVERKVVVAPAPIRERDGFPMWALVPIVLVGVIVLSVMFYLFTDRADDTANANIRVSTTGSRTTDPSRGGSRTESVSDDVRTAPPSEVHTTTVPGTGAVPVSAPAPDKGTVAINATLTTPNGSPRAAKSVKFYLLDKDVETILSEARIEPIEGNTLAGSLGLSMVYPDRFGDFQRDAMRAIASHAKYSGTTDGTGIANLAGVVPTNYYLFSVTRVGHGFAMWDSPVSINAGENVMNLSPQSVTEIPDANG
jgi:zinc ribbon protein